MFYDTELINYYKNNLDKRLFFLNKNYYLYFLIANKINKQISENSNILFVGAGHIKLIDFLKCQKIYVNEITSNFYKNYEGNKNIFIADDLLEKFNFDDKKIDFIILSNLEYISDPLNYLKKLNEKINKNTKIFIISHNIFWNPLIKILTNLNILFKHPRKNIFTKGFIENLAILSNFKKINHIRTIIFPFKFTFIEKFFNNYFSKIPLVDRFSFINILLLEKKENLEKKYLNDFSVSIIVPCKNEEKNIVEVINKMKNFGKRTEVLFGDDNSSDNTKEEVIKNSKIRSDIEIKIYDGPGISKSQNVYKGFDIASGDILVIHDADNTVRPNEISNFINALIDNPSSFINGTRFVYPMTLNAMKSSNFYGNIFFSYLFSLILNQSITDTLCGTKVFFRKDWKSIKKDSGKWGIRDKWGDYDLLLGAKKNSLKVLEIPVNYVDREHESSKMTNSFLNGLRMLVISIYGFFKLRF